MKEDELIDPDGLSIFCPDGGIFSQVENELYQRNYRWICSSRRETDVGWIDMLRMNSDCISIIENMFLCHAKYRNLKDADKNVIHGKTFLSLVDNKSKKISKIYSD
jgi:hypothetical protein